MIACGSTPTHVTYLWMILMNQKNQSFQQCPQHQSESKINPKATQDSVVTTAPATSISKENNKTWYDTNEEYDSWHDAAGTIDNYQESIIMPTVVREMNIKDPII